MTIRILADHVVNQIAAGEVVDRPVAIVRELVDNSVDAGAREVRVRLEQGGHSLIAVQDDGCGMTHDDALLAFERHATSKIQNASDLDRIMTRGFRGEALAAIASVSKVSVKTRCKGSEHGTEVVIEAGKVRAVRACACPEGTLIEVRALFFNTPARRKFLRSPRVEEARIREWLEAAALGAPVVHFRLAADGRERLNLPPARTSIERARHMIRGNAVEIERETELAVIRALVLHPEHAARERAPLAILVNGRLVSDRMLARAAKEGFGAVLREREFPSGMLSIDVPPQQVDVNVHPQKSEVRFRAAQAIFGIVKSSIEQAVAQFRAPLAARDLGLPQAAVEQERVSFRSEIAQSGLFSVRELQPVLGPEQRESESRSPQEVHSYPFRFSDLVYCGQIFECYLVCQCGDRCVIVDMHAAHERCNFNRILARMQDRQSISQRLLLPRDVSMGAIEFEEVREHEHTLSELGFEFTYATEPEALPRVTLNAIPAFLSLESAVQALLDILRAGDSVLGNDVETRREKLAARIACHASVRSGKTMTREEVAALFADLDAALAAAHCPHGRPVAVFLEQSDFERMFGRND